MLASPLTSRVSSDASEHVEHRWSLVPAADGNMHLVDLNPLEIQTIEPMFNAQSDVFYLLYTQSSPNGVRIGMNANEIRGSTFNAAHPTRFLIHGWLNNQTATVNVLSIEAYLRRGNFNIIVVDWGAGAQTINYISARNRVNEVAPVVANFIDFLNLNGFISFDRLNVIGHSLGAHVAGIIGKRVTRGRIQSIFALDPANPLFSLNAPDTRVAPTDAGKSSIGRFLELMSKLIIQLQLMLKLSTLTLDNEVSQNPLVKLTFTLTGDHLNLVVERMLMEVVLTVVQLTYLLNRSTQTLMLKTVQVILKFEIADALAVDQE